MPLSLHLSYACNVGEDERSDNLSTREETNGRFEHRNVEEDVERNNTRSWGFRSTATSKIRSFLKKAWKFSIMWAERLNKVFWHWVDGVDWRQVFHALKAGLTLGLVSCIVLTPEVYDALGKNVLWAVLTVVVSFECTVGATIIKGLNRTLGTMFAALLGLLFDHFANQLSAENEPYLVGIAVLSVGMFTAYIRFNPVVKAKYDYGAVMLPLTFTLVTVSGYRSPSTVDTVLDRMLTVLIGCIACLLVNVLVYPIWAGDDLHNLIINNFEDLALAIEGCTEQYFFGEEKDIEASRRTSKICKGEAFNDPIYKGYRAVLISKQMEENLANFAIWEPWHCRFGYSYPWDLCLNVGAILRHIACSVCALHGCILSDTQPPDSLRQIFSQSSMQISSEIVKVLREVADSFKFFRKTNRSRETMLDDLHKAVLQLHKSLEHYNGRLVSQFHVADDVNDSCGPAEEKPPCHPSEIEEHTCSAKCGKLTESLFITTFVCLLIEIASHIKPLLKVVRELEVKGHFTDPDKPRRRSSLKRYKTDKMILQHTSSDIYPF